MTACQQIHLFEAARSKLDFTEESISNDQASFKIQFIWRDHFKF